MGNWTRAEINRLRHTMISQGRSIDDIAAEIRHVTGCSPLAAYRMAHGLSQPEAATRFREQANAAYMDQALLSRLEQFPSRGSRPPLAAQLIAFANVYETTPLRLVATSALEKLEPREREALVQWNAALEHFSPSLHPQRETSEQSSLLQSVNAPPEIADYRGSNLEEKVGMAARRALRFSVRAGGTNIGPEVLQEIYSELGRIAKAYPQQPVAALLSDLAELQDATFRILEGHQRPSQARDTYLMAGLLQGFWQRPAMISATPTPP